MDSGMDLLLEFLSRRLVEEISTKEDGYCMRVDHLTEEVARSLCGRIASVVGADRCYVLVAKKNVRELVASELNTERAIELRNRKPVAFILLVPTGVIDSTASSLRNAFAAFDLDKCWRHGQSILLKDLPAETKDYVERTLRISNLPGISEEDRAAYCASVASASAAADAAARELYRVGLIPDESLDVSRLEDNIRASKELVRPIKSYASLSDRLDTLGVQPGEQREALETFFAQRQLSDWRSWMRDITASGEPKLRFSAWDLVTRSKSKLRSLKLTSWLDANGAVEKWSKLIQPEPGTQPHAIVGAKSEIAVRWESDPQSPEGLEKWRVDLIPSRDFYTTSETPDVLLPSKLVKGTLKRTALKLSAIDWPEDVASIVVQVRLTAISENGGELEDENSQRFEAISDEIQLRPETESEGESESSSRVLKVSRDVDGAKLQLAVDKGRGESDLEDSAFHWSGTADNVFNLELSSGDKVRIGYSSVLKHLESQSIAAPDYLGRWHADLVTGESHPFVEQFAEAFKPTSNSAQDFLQARRRFFRKLESHGPRRWLAVTPWTPELVADAQHYVESYGVWITEARGAELENALGIETGTVRLRTDGRTIVASVNSPLHPLKVAWLLYYRRLVESKLSAVISSSDSATERRERLDFGLLQSIEPIGCPMLSHVWKSGVHLTVGCLDFLWTVGLPLDWPDPERGLALVSQALDVASTGGSNIAMTARIAGHVNDYLTLHPHVQHLRFVTDNAGDGRLSADVLCSSVAGGDREDENFTSVDSGNGPQRIELLAHFREPLPAQLPGLDSLRQMLEQRGGNKAASVFQPLLETSIRPSDQLTAIGGGGTHLTLLMDVTKATVHVEAETANRGTAALDGLLAPFRLLEGGPPWRYSVPESRTETELTQQIIVHQRSVARMIDINAPANSLPVLHVAIEGDEQRLRSIHEQSDWVITLDRFVEPAWLESNAGMRYLLDYSPDVSDGLSRRLFVSTGHREEAEQLLSETLTDLGVQPTDGVVTCVLQRLRQVSGRLALRTFGSSSSRREATALAIAIDHLLKSGELEESVLIPVDSHMEVFSPVKRRGRPEKSRRCDLLSVSLTKTGVLKLSLFEVKGRSHRPSPDVFATICDQLQTTQTLLEALWCDESRTDRDLQLYRLRQILEYHLRRACGFGTVSDISRWHPTLEKLAAGEIQIKMSMHGIVVCPRAMPETVRRGEIEIRVIGEVELSTIPNDSEEALPVQDAFVPKKPPAAHPPEKRLSGHDTSPETHANGSTGTSLPVAKIRKSKRNDQNPEVDTEQDFGVGNVFGTAFGQAIDEDRNHGVDNVIDRSTPTAEEESLPRTSDIENIEAPEAPPHKQQPDRPRLFAIPFESVEDTATMNRVSPPPEPVKEHRSSVSREAASGGVEVVMGDGHDGPVTWKPAVAGSPHLFIIGIPGQGKSVTTTRLLCELTKQNVPALVLDFHGEFAKPEGPFAQLADPSIMDAADGLPFSILEPKHGEGPRAKEAIWELAEICQYVCGLGDIQRDALYRSFELAYASVPDGSTPLLKDVGALIQDDEQDGNTKNVIARCRPLFEFGLFADSPSEAIYDQFRKGAVIDLHHLKSETLQLAAGAFTLRKLYRAMFSWGPAKRIRLAIVLDEAHRLAKDLTLPRIMKEGRKFGVAVVVASQDVRDFHDQVLSNAGTKVVFRVNYPDSRKVAGFVRAERGEALSSRIERLGVGEAMIQTPDMATADWVRMRQFDD